MKRRPFRIRFQQKEEKLPAEKQFEIYTIEKKQEDQNDEAHAKSKYEKGD
jgi:hypothetical protein